MAGAVASSILGMIFDNLGTMIPDELRSFKDVGEELKKLESTLSTIRNVLEDAEARPVKEKALVDWLKKLKDVAYDIDDVLDEAAVEAVKRKPDQFESKEMVRKYLSFPKSLRFRHEIATKIKEIRKRLDMISEEKSRFHLREGAAEHSDVINNGPGETGSYVDKSRVYGRDEDKKRIIDFLLNKFDEKNLGVISIVGIGGLGKTTLAQLVYNDGQVSRHFVTKIWVYVSEKFEIKNVIKSIIESLTSQECKPLGMDSMEQELLKQIKGKRFLLVLDDVWNEDYRPWEKLGSLLNNGAKGSKVIITTRSTRVASVMKSDELHSPSVLPDDDCWKLFEDKAFENGVNADNRNLVAIGKEIVNKCGGLPLAAKALGSVLRFKREESQWRAVRDNDIWTLFEDDQDILPALMLSYNQLSPCLKQCFVYCSIFPKGTKIKVEMLVQLWVAEGFVGSSGGSQYVDQLISRSLLEKAMADGFVKMHDMVHNLAKYVAGDECSIIDKTGGSNTNVSPNSRYTSLFLDEATPSIELILSSGQKLRTLHLISYGLNSHEKEDICQKVFDTIFSNMKLLRALHLPALAIRNVPASIENLIHLRYLDLSSTKLENLPQTVGLLHNLQILKLKNTYLKTLPNSIGDLVNLFTLDISYCRRFHSLPDTIGKLIHLQYLDLSGTKLQTLPSTIGTLHNLETLRMSYCRQLEMLPESIGSLPNLLTLNLACCKSLHSLSDTIGKLVHLKYLDLSKTNLRTLPRAIGGLENLLSLDISSCKNLRSLTDDIGCICSLQILDISYINAIQKLPESLSSMYNLRRLHVDFCCRLSELPKNIRCMRSLTHLHIDGCHSLTSIPAGIGQLSQLQMLPMYVLSDGENSASLAELGTLMNLEGRLRIKNLQNVKDTSEASAANLREKESIDELELEWDFDADWTDENYGGMDDFENKRKALMERAAAMDGERVRLLEDISGSLQPHQNLQDLRIKGYVGKMLPGWMMDIPAAPFLVELRLESFARCDDLQALEKLSCLEVLELKRFPFIECLPGLGQLPRLRVLSLYMLPGVKCLGSELYGGAGAFPALHELGLEFMSGLEEWSGNPADGGDVFHCRPSRLVLRDCPRLQALPSTFPSVEELGMNADDELLQRHLRSGAFRNANLDFSNCEGTESDSDLGPRFSVWLPQFEESSLCGSSIRSAYSSPYGPPFPEMDRPRCRIMFLKKQKTNEKHCYILRPREQERLIWGNRSRSTSVDWVDTEDESSMSGSPVKRLHSAKSIRKHGKLSRWNHSRSELEKMRLETLERIATEIENKLVIKPSL